MTQAKKPKTESFIIFKGEEIVGNATSLAAAKEIFKNLPPKTRILDGRAIYKLVMED